MTERAATTAETTIRLSGPRGMAAAVPQLLGFEPEESLVLLCLRAPRGRVGPVARVDLFPPDAVDPIDQLVGCAVRYADAVAVLCYHHGDLPACLGSLVAALRQAEVPLAQVLSISNNRIRDASTPARFRCDHGVAVAAGDDRQSRRLAAAAALVGRQVLPNRESLRSSIAPPRGRRLMQSREAIDRQWDLLATSMAVRGAAPADGAVTERADAAFASAVIEHRRTGVITLDSAAELIVLAGHIASRDLLVARAVGCEDPEIVALLIAVASRCPDEDAAEICAVLAVAAYRYGDGALAQCAVDRVLAVEPRHRLAHLMLAIMAACLPPGELAAMADIAPDGRGAAGERDGGRDGDGDDGRDGDGDDGRDGDGDGDGGW